MVSQPAAARLSIPERVGRMKHTLYTQASLFRAKHFLSHSYSHLTPLPSGRPYLDGAVRDLAGVEGVRKGERVLYHHGTVAPMAMAGIAGKCDDSVTLSLSGVPWILPWSMQVGVASCSFPPG